MIKNIFYPIIIGTIFCSCKKSSPDNNAPQVSSQIGADILYCKVNGHAHKYEGKRQMIDSDGVEVGERKLIDSTKGFVIIADKTEYDDFILLFIKVPNSSDTNSFSPPLINNVYKMTNNFYQKSSYECGGVEYIADTANSTIVFTRFDNEIVAGKFEFHGFDQNHEPIAITEGVFDISRK